MGESFWHNDCDYAPTSKDPVLPTLITIPRVNNNRRSRLYLINPDSSFSALFSCKMAGDVSRVFLNLSQAQPELN